MKKNNEKNEYGIYDLALMFVFALILLSFFSIMFLVLFLSIYRVNKNLDQQIVDAEEKAVVFEGEDIPAIHILPNIEFESIKHADLIEIKDIAAIAAKEYSNKMIELHNGYVDKETWYLEYKNMLNRFNEYLDMPETVYDVYNNDEIYLIQRTVETETFQCSFDAKVNVASVIFNRLSDEKFGESVNEVITSPKQFAYWRTKISDTTRLAVEYAFEIEDTTGGCIAFRSDVKPTKWGKWEYSFSDNAVHHFYKERKED